MRVLVVEDQKKIAAFIRKALESEGMAVDVQLVGDAGFMRAAAPNFDVIILDIMLPGSDGLTLLRDLRKHRISTPVLLLTARGAMEERVEGLNLGADDYLAKPFALLELIARVRALGRRTTGSQSVELRVGDLTLDTITRRARRDGRVLPLSAREYRLLEFLMRNHGRVCTRPAIVESVWNYQFDPGTNLVDVYMKRLRDKIEDGFEGKLLHTIPRVGYMIKQAV